MGALSWSVLRAECEQLRVERDLLKASMAFWVKENSAPCPALGVFGTRRMAGSR